MGTSRQDRTGGGDMPNQRADVATNQVLGEARKSQSTALRDRSLAAMFWISLAILLVIFFAQFETVLWSSWNPAHFAYTAAHIAAAGFMTVIWFLHRKRHSIQRWFASAVMLVGFAASGYYFYTRALEIIPRTSFGAWPDMILGVLVFVLALYLSWLYWGPIFPILSILAVGYAFIADLMPGPFKGPSFELHVIVTHFVTVIYGGTFTTSALTTLGARFFWLLIFWGLLLSTAGGGVAILGLAKLLSRSGVAGGPAMGALVASAVTGSFIGAGPANVAITGPITIPAMRKAGYTAEQAGAVESIASNASNITPPILGIVAFIMADVIGVSYLEIIAMSIVPALLWYMAAGVYIFAHAKRHQDVIQSVLARELDAAGADFIPWHRYLRSALVVVGPVAVLLWLILDGYSLRMGAVGAFLTLLVLSVILRVETRWSAWSAGIREAAFVASSVSLILVIVAVMTDVITWTGLGGRMGNIIETASGGQVMLAGLMMIAVGIFLSAGLPTLAVYFIMTISFTPVLTRMDVDFRASHYVAFYIGTLNNIVPPVATSALLAAAIAGTRYWAVCVVLTKMSWPMWVFPLLFLTAPELLLLGESGTAMTLFIVGSSAVVIAGVQTASAGWLLRPLIPIVRIVLYVNFGLLVVALNQRVEALLGLCVAVVVACAAATLVLHGRQVRQTALASSEPTESAT